MEFLGIYLTESQWIIIILCSLFMGMAKTGIQGIANITIPLMAISFGAKESTGIILPILCLADLIAVVYYKKSCQFKYVFKLLPYAILGFFIAIAIDKIVPHHLFKILIAFCILGGFVIMVFDKKLTKNNIIQNSLWYAPLFGILGGFSTMIGNAAGPIMAVYLLSMKLPKYAFVGTNAWFFLFVNYLKLPLQAFVWNNISLQSLYLNTLCIPFIIIGGIIGIYFIKIIPEKIYKNYIMLVTLLSTLILFF